LRKADPSVLGDEPTGAATRAFMPAADISELATCRCMRRRNQPFRAERLGLSENLGQPVIAAINGFVAGRRRETADGLTMGSRRSMPSSAMPEVKWACCRRGWWHQRLPRLVGKGRALQAHPHRGTSSAQEANARHRNEVVPAAQSDRARRGHLEADRGERANSRKFSWEAANKGWKNQPAEGLCAGSFLLGIALRPKTRRRVPPPPRETCTAISRAEETRQTSRKERHGSDNISRTEGVDWQDS